MSVRSCPPWSIAGLLRSHIWHISGTHPARIESVPAIPGSVSVGNTGIEPVTHTVSMFSIRRWLRWLAPTLLVTGAPPGWLRRLQRFLAVLVLHDRCTRPRRRNRYDGEPSPIRRRAKPVWAAKDERRHASIRYPSSVIASQGLPSFWSTGDRYLTRLHRSPRSSSAIHCWKNARIMATSTSTSPRARSTSQ